MPTQDPDTWMWKRARDLLERADRLHRHYFELAPPGERRATWEPPVDIFETQTELWVLVALPGVRAEDVDVRLGPEALFVSGESPMPELCRHTTVHRLEIPHGRFARRVDLPVACGDLIRREMSNGLLVLGLAKRL